MEHVIQFCILGVLLILSGGMFFMALNLTALQTEVATLTADVNKLIALPATDQTQVDAITAALQQLDTAVKAALPPGA